MIWSSFGSPSNRVKDIILWIAQGSDHDVTLTWRKTDALGARACGLDCFDKGFNGSIATCVSCNHKEGQDITVLTFEDE